ncbi:RidA family protein [Alloalcanivorax marinus]|uniref:RidA family protein n=1 Tax=Alloalcanivorax marinus TaxID=1177169 RepID=UPI001934321B|nr:RidA family protein [Alloalcanivorax marinus]MBL7251093.1 RidA family protein [Alloalcanivorax marinus]
MSENIEYINPQGVSPAQGLYSHLTKVKSGDLYYIAGQLSVGMDGSVVGIGDFEAQFHQVFGNLKGVLATLGLDFNDIVKFNTYMVDSADIPEFMRLRQETFPSFFATEVYAPNTLLMVQRLVKQEFLLEVEAVARSRD